MSTRDEQLHLLQELAAMVREMAQAPLLSADDRARLDSLIYRMHALDREQTEQTSGYRARPTAKG